jgi:PilZ domain
MPSPSQALGSPGLRRWARFEADVPVRVIVTNASRVLILDGRGNALNEGGMAMFAGVELRLGDQVAVEFTPAYSGPIRVEGRICNRSGYIYGLEFLTDTSTRQEQAARFRNQLANLVSSVEN